MEKAMKVLTRFLKKTASARGSEETCLTITPMMEKDNADRSMNMIASGLLSMFSFTVLTMGIYMPNGILLFIISSDSCQNQLRLTDAL